MKIGIMTFWWSEDNYGQLLQCYALQKYLRDAGHDAYLIRYRFERDITSPIYIKFLKAFNPSLLLNYISEKIRNRKNRTEQIENNRHFEDFRKKYIVQSKNYYNSYSELKTNPPEADCYIVGSDQVWNFLDLPLKQAKKMIHAYFLDFGSTKIKRISYAASWGMKNISNKNKEEITPLLKKFDFVSVREKSGIKICNECGKNNVEWVCDPTILIKAEVYRKIYKENEIKSFPKKYLLLYILHNKIDFDIDYIYRFASNKNLEIVYVTGNGVVDKNKKVFATIPEWLYLVDNAEYIITNSFHCGVFSLIFNKQFGIIPLSGKYSGMNARFDSLFDLFEIENRFIEDYNFNILDKVYNTKKMKLYNFNNDTFCKLLDIENK